MHYRRILTERLIYVLDCTINVLITNIMFSILKLLFPQFVCSAHIILEWM